MPKRTRSAILIALIAGALAGCLDLSGPPPARRCAPPDTISRAGNPYVPEVIVQTCGPISIDTIILSG